MREVIDNILVIGHHNPDTDASASAFAYANFLNQIGRYDQHVLAAVPGPLTPQAKYVFERAGKPEPPLVKNVARRVGHVYTPVPVALGVEDRIGDAIEQLVRSGVSMLPVLEHGRLHGIFSNRSDAARFLFGLDPTPLWGSLITVSDLVSMPGVTRVGSVEPRSPEGGDLRIAIEGDDAWKQSIRSEDVLVCGNLSVVEGIPTESRPANVVVLTDVSHDDPLVHRLNETGTSVLHFGQGIAEFLRGLTLRIRLGSLSLPKGPSVGELDLVEDIQELLDNNHFALPVLSDDAEFRGVISSRDLSGTKRCRVILVDHFERPQAVNGLDGAEILEVVDHHRVGDVQSDSPIRVTCRPVGSCCTIVASEYFERGVPLDSGTALVLLGGVVADTLVLRSPTTTETDRQIAQQLAEVAGVDLREFGTEVLVAGDDLVTSDPHEIWNRDQKRFSIRNQNFSVAQLETAAIDRVSDEKLRQFKDLVSADQSENGLLLSVLVLTDVMLGDSWIAASESQETRGLIGSAFSEKQPKPGWNAAPGIVSRKKQIVPRIMQALST